MPFLPLAQASPVQRMDEEGVQVRQLGLLPHPTPSKLPMHEPTWPAIPCRAMYSASFWQRSWSLPWFMDEV